MKHLKIANNPANRRIIVFFNGWAMDGAAAHALAKPGYDVLVLWDYRHLDFDPAWVDGYDEICLFAWSFGVYAAATAMAPFAHRLTTRVAINGTPYPIDAQRGIHPRILQATIKALHLPNGREYVEAILAGGPQNDAFAMHRSVDDAADELQCFADAYSALTENVAPRLRWDHAYVADHDQIVPTKRQLAHWQQTPTMVHTVAGEHYIDIAAIVEQHLIDKQLVESRFSGAKSTYSDYATIQNVIADHLNALLPDALSGNVLEIGAGSGYLTDLYAPRLSADAQLSLWDLVDYGCQGVAGRNLHLCDAETEIRQLPDECADCIISASTIQWFNSPFAFIAQAARVLRHGGCALFSTFAPDNLDELAAFMPKRLPLPTVDQWQQFLSGTEGIAVEAIAQEQLPISFDTPRQLLEHLRLTGVNAISRQGSDGVRRLLGDKHAPTTLTYRPIYLKFRKL